MEKLWSVKTPNPELQEKLSRELQVSQITAQVLINRGFTDVEQTRLFLSGTDLHDPLLMKDMKKAVTRIKKAIKEGKKIVIAGDYDADGVTSTCLLVDALRSLAADVTYYIPHRINEGYGLSKDAVDKLYTDGCQMIITVDNGISCAEEVAYARKLGMEVIITDHHDIPEKLPKAHAIINPKQEDCGYPFKELAGVGVALKLAQALKCDITPLLELVCIGTIADVVPLVGENREILKRGLPLVGNKPGVRALMDIAGINGVVSSENIAFGVGPRINAAGRMAHANAAVELLMAKDKEAADGLAKALNDLNVGRQKAEAGITSEAMQIIEAMGYENDRVIVVANPGWHHGLVGIVASRILNKYYRPVIVLGIDDGVAKGSCRSIPGFHLFEALKEVSDILVKHGGHAMAAGLTLTEENIDALRQRMNKIADRVLTEEHLLPKVEADTLLSLTEVDETLLTELQNLEPFGAGNERPCLLCNRLSVMDNRLLSEGKHLKLKVTNGAVIMDSIGFGKGEMASIAPQGSKVDVVFNLDKNEWQGKTNLQLRLIDIRATEEEGGALSFIDSLYDQAAELLVNDYYRDIGERDEFFTKVVGVTFEDRQLVLQSIEDGEAVRLVREPENKFDPNAIRVDRLDGTQIGFLKKDLARYLSQVIDKGEKYNVVITCVTGKDSEDKNLGANLSVSRVCQETDETELADRISYRKALRFLNQVALRDHIRQALLDNYGYRGKQEEAIDALFAGNNTLAVFGTGRGKSAVFQSVAAYMAIKEKGMTVIVYPLRALVNDQYEALSAKLSPLGIRVFKGNGSLTGGERGGLFKALENGTVDILLTTPEFLGYHMEKITANSTVNFFVVDESHHIADTHRPAYRRLGELKAQLGNPLTLAVTATANDNVADEIVNTLGIDNVIIDQYVRENLEIFDCRNMFDKSGYLKQVVGSGAKTIIYVNSRMQTVELAMLLRDAIPEMRDKVIFYHAGLTSEQRVKVEEMFRNSEVTTVISTSAFGEGIDITDVRHVVVYHLNFNFTEFNQQCGRCGRDGQRAQIHLLCGERDARINEFILEQSCPDRDVLAAIYRVLCKMGKEIQATNDDLAGVLSRTTGKKIEGGAVSAGLGILEELNLIERDGFGAARKIIVCDLPDGKLDLNLSMRYIEGQQEKTYFQEFKEFFFHENSHGLRDFINRPLCPEKYVQEKPKSA